MSTPELGNKYIYVCTQHTQKNNHTQQEVKIIMHMSCFPSLSTHVLVVFFTFLVLNSNDNYSGQVLAINLSLVEIYNDMPSSSPLVVEGTFPEGEVKLKKGTPYSFIPTGNKDQSGEFILKQEELCSGVLLYEANVDYKKKRIYWFT